MSKAEKFIQEYTRNCSNVFVNPQLGGTEENHPWLTPDQARRAVELAMEEMVEKVCSFIADNISEYIELKHASPTTFVKIDGDRLAIDLKQAMKKYE